MLELSVNDTEFKIINSKPVHLSFDKTICYGGTIIYGTFFNQHFFTIEDILYWKGNKLYVNWIKKIELINQLMTNYIKQNILTDTFLCIGLANLTNNFNELINVDYKIKKIQFYQFERNNNYKVMNYNEFNKLESKNTQITNFQNNKQNKKKYQKIFNTFIVKPDIQNEIYHLLCLNDKKEEIFYDFAHIPDLKTSIFMNNLFRNIKENKNLDLLEESDDEDDFEDNRIDKYVFLNKKYNMVCEYNYKFSKWVPIQVNEDLTIQIVSLHELNLIRTK
jgi:hypothetical protein